MSLPMVFAAFCLALPTFLVLIPQAMVPLLALAAATIALLQWRRERRLPWSWLWPGPALGWPLVLLFAWSLVSCLWALEQSESLSLLLRLAALVLAGLFFIAAAATLDEAERELPRQAILIGFAIALAVVVLERAFGQPIYTTFGPTDPGHSPLSAMNRGATGLAILAWPVTALLLRGRAGRWALLLPPALLLLLQFLESASAMLALVLGALLALLALWRPWLGRLVLIAVVVVTIGLAPLVPTWFGDGELSRSPWLDYASQHRTEIWRFAAEHIADKPLLGWGFDSADDMAAAGIAPDDATGRNLMPSHPHNAVLQVWLELGVIGAAIGLALLLTVTWRLDRLPPVEAAAAQATFLSSFIVGLVSYGIWQSQWIGTLLAAATIVTLIRSSRDATVATPAPSAESAGRRSLERRQGA